MTSPAELEKILKQRQKRMKPESAKNGSLEIHLRRRIRVRDVTDFTRQLATMVQARLPLARSLGILAQQQKNSGLQQIIRGLIQRISGGSSLSQSLSNYPRLFNSLYINMVYMGEVTGNMADILQQLALYMEKIAELKRKLFTALTYPSVIVLVAIGAISFLMFGVMPTFTDMFRDFGAQMPLPTQILIGASEFVKSKIIFFLLAFVIVGLCIRMFSRTEKGSWLLDRIQLKIPLIGAVIKKVFIARFSRTLGTLLNSGVTLLEALDITAKSSSNRVMKKQIMQMRDMAVKGEPMGKSLTGSSLFPPLVVQMIAVGEETAELPDMLLKTTEFYENEVDAAIDALTSIIEPIIIVVLGVVLGGTMIAIYLQIFDLMNVVQ